MNMPCIIGFLAGMLLVPLAYAQKEATSGLLKVGDVAVGGYSKDVHLSYSTSGDEILVQQRAEKSTASGIRILEPGMEHKPDRQRFEILKIVRLNENRLAISETTSASHDGMWEFNGKIFQDAEAPEVKKSLSLGKESVPSIQNSSGQTIRFEDVNGDAVSPDISLTTWYRKADGTFRNISAGGCEGLFIIIHGVREEITPEDHRGFSRFSYDPIKERVLVKGCPIGDVLYDIRSKSRQIIPNFDADAPAEKINYLIPGRDTILTQTNRLNQRHDDYIGLSMGLYELKGDLLASVDLTNGEGTRVQYPTNITCSQHMIAYTLANHGLFIRIYVINDE